MNDLWSGLVGALIGGAIAGAAAWGVFRGERRDRHRAERGRVTAEFVRHLTDLQECVVNPTRNGPRWPAVESAAQASLTYFLAQLRYPEEMAVGEFAPSP